jgi:hypothetical protein
LLEQIIQYSSLVSRVAAVIVLSEAVVFTGAQAIETDGSLDDKRKGGRSEAVMKEKFYTLHSILGDKLRLKL